MWGRPFGEQMRAMRVLRGLAQGDLAVLLGATRAAVAGWERRHGSPGHDTMQEVAEALGCTLVVLLVPHEVSGEGVRGKALGRMKSGRRRLIGLSEFGDEVEET